MENKPEVTRVTDNRLEFNGNFLLKMLRKEGYDVPESEKDITFTKLLLSKKRNEPFPKDKYKFVVTWKEKEVMSPFLVLGGDK